MHITSPKYRQNDTRTSSRIGGGYSLFFFLCWIELRRHPRPGSGERKSVRVNNDFIFLAGCRRGWGMKYDHVRGNDPEVLFVIRKSSASTRYFAKKTQPGSALGNPSPEKPTRKTHHLNPEGAQNKMFLSLSSTTDAYSLHAALTPHHDEMPRHEEEAGAGWRAEEGYPARCRMGFFGPNGHYSNTNTHLLA